MLLSLTSQAIAQDSYNDRAKKYIDQYGTLAIEEQKKNGIPAAITLGQGILETEAGASELMTVANNHFGIKCGNGWMGQTFSHTDDAPDECFKRYACVQDSYRDHSEHLKRNPRYAPLFSVPQTDYAGWAVCLKKCGYATNPQYAQNLIKIIEDFKLQEYTYTALGKATPVDLPSTPVSNKSIALDDESAEDTGKTVVADTIVAAKEQADIDPIKKIADSARSVISQMQAPAPQTDTVFTTNEGTDIAPIGKIADSANNMISHAHASGLQTDTVAATASNNYENSKLITVNGLKAFYAYKDEMLLQYAMKFNIRYPKLLEMNDLPDAPLAFNAYVYVEKKRGSGTHTQHAVKEGETMLMISQIEGIQLKRLQVLNLFQPGEEPAAGTILELQFPARKKPLVMGSEIASAKKENAPARITAHPVQQCNDYVAAANIPTAEPKPLQKPVQAAVKNVAAITTAQQKPIAEVTESADTAEDIEETADGKKKEDLTALKAELDKEVYADDSKLAVKKATVAAPAKPLTPEAPLAGKKAEKYYKVKKGDTAFSIAKRNNVSLDDLMKWNKIKSGVKVGQLLQVKE